MLTLFKFFEMTRDEMAENCYYNVEMGKSNAV
jgi:hypothetical protein